MTKYITGRTFGLELCKALGLDEKRVVSIELRAHCGEVASATVEFFVSSDEAEEIANELKRYELVEVDGAED